MADNFFWIALLAVLVAQFAGPFLLARLLRNHIFRPAHIWLTCFVPGALVGLGVGFSDHQWGPDLFAGLVMATPPALVALLCHHWSRKKPNGQQAFNAFAWWSLATAWFCATGGFVFLGFLAQVFQHTGPDGVLGTAVKIGALGGGMCGLVLGGPVGLIRLLILANQPNSAVLEPEAPANA